MSGVINTTNIETANIKHTNGTTAATVSSGGVITANNGINLGNEVLDSYREGTWTPTISASNVLSGSWNVTSAKYTKIGQLVHCNFQVNSAGASGNWATTDYITMGGFPFTSASQGHGSCTAATNFTNASYVFFHITLAVIADTTVYINPVVTHGSIPRSNHLFGGFSYFTSQ